MSLVSMSRRVIGLSPSYFGQPAANFVVAHLKFFETVAYAGVAGKVARGQSRICLVPALGRNLVMPLEMLEVLLEPGAPGDEPVGGRIGHEAGEGEVQSKPGLVDEVVHIGFMAAVIIAAEKAAAMLVDKHPMREMDCADAPDRSTGEDVARHPIDPVNDHDLR